MADRDLKRRRRDARSDAVPPPTAEIGDNGAGTEEVSLAAGKPEPSVDGHLQTRSGEHATTPDLTLAEQYEPAPGAVLDQARLSPLVALPRRLSTEAALWFLLLFAAALTRFWDLSSRALHHDESLHAFYSWGWAAGTQPYVHNPLMHGPFLFHANALVYLLLGDSDATSRIVPALFGVALVGLPWLLRGPRFLGRWGALIAGALFLISPAFLYYSRYIRHDLYTVVGSLVLLIAVVRYLERPQRRWLVTAGASLAFLLTNHEIIFAIALVFGLVLWGALLRGPLRPLVPLHIGAAAGAAAVWFGLGRVARPLPGIPWDARGRESLPPTRENTLRFYGDLVTHPLIIGFVLLGVGVVVLAWYVLARHRDPDRTNEGWLPSLFGDPPEQSVAAGVRAAWKDRNGLLIAAGVGLTIFAALFTSMFTNIDGLATATFATDGTLLYWLGQHDVQRGEQPWFYFLLLMPQYEILAFFLGSVATLLVGWRAFRAARGGVASPALFFQIFVAIWFVFMFGVLSWAGEKMPWLVVHISLPATLLAASLLGELVERARAWRARTGEPERRYGWATPSLTVALLIGAGSWFLLAGRLTYGTIRWIPDDASAEGGAWQRLVTDSALDRWWLMTLPPIAALALIAASWRCAGGRRTGYAAIVALVVGLGLYQVHMAWRMSYLEGDVARDMLIYNTTSPDVTQMMEDLTELSAELHGDKSLAIWFDEGTSWPMQWYLRDFPNKRYFGASLTGPPEDAPVLLVANVNRGGVQNQMAGYTAQEYVLRWHEPEWAIYRNFAIAPELPPGRSAWGSAAEPHGPVAIARSVASSLGTQLTPSGQQRAYRIVMYRELPTGLNDYSYTLYVRDDLLPLYNDIRYGG